MRKYDRPALTAVRPADPVFAARIKNLHYHDDPFGNGKIVDTGRLEAFRLTALCKDDKEKCIPWDSDTAKVLEGMAYSLALEPDEKLEKFMMNGSI